MLEGITQEDLNKINSRILRRLNPAGPSDDHAMHEANMEESRNRENTSRTTGETAPLLGELHVTRDADIATGSPSFLQKVLKWIKIYGRFIGPGFMVGKL